MKIKEVLHGRNGKEQLTTAERAAAYGATAVAACGLGFVLGQLGTDLKHDADSRFDNSSHGLVVVPNLEIAASGLLVFSGIGLEVLAVSAAFPAISSARQVMQEQSNKQ